MDGGLGCLWHGFKSRFNLRPLRKVMNEGDDATRSVLPEQCHTKLFRVTDAKT